MKSIDQLRLICSPATTLVLGKFGPSQFADYSFTHTFTKDDLCLEISPALSSAPTPDHVLLFSTLKIQKLDGQIQ